MIERNFKPSRYDTRKTEDKCRDITIHASKLRPAFVLSPAQEFVFKTQDCDFYSGKMIGGKKKKRKRKGHT